jgi:hypothetical protein
LRAELNQKTIKLNKACEQLENKKKRIAELTQELQLMKDKTWRQIQSQTKIDALQSEVNMLKQCSTKYMAELTQLKD